MLPPKRARTKKTPFGDDPATVVQPKRARTKKTPFGDDLATVVQPKRAHKQKTAVNVDAATEAQPKRAREQKTAVVVDPATEAQPKPARKQKTAVVVDPAIDATDVEAPPIAPPPSSNAMAGALYNMPRKVTKKGPRIDLYPPDGVRTVPLGYAWKYSFEKNCDQLREAASEPDGWQPAEIHFKMNGVLRNWHQAHGEEGCAAAQRLKAWVEQEWPSAFTGHKNVPGEKP